MTRKKRGWEIKKEKKKECQISFRQKNKSKNESHERFANKKKVTGGREGGNYRSRKAQPSQDSDG